MPTVLPRVLAVARAGMYGVSDRHLRTYVRRGLWSRVAPGIVLTAPGLPRRTDWLAVGLIAGGPSAAVSGTDALDLAGIPVASDALPPLVLTGRRDSRTIGELRVRWTQRSFETWTTGIVGHDADDLAYARVVRPARALSDSAGLGASRDQLRAWVTSAVQRRACTADQLVAELRAGPRNGSAALRAAIEDVQDGARSIAEARAVDRLRRATVPPFELNVPVVIRGRVLVVDVLWRQLRAVLEVDSRRYHASGAAWERTLARHNMLTACGLAVRHDAPSAVARGRRWSDEVAAWLRDRARELGVPFTPSASVIRAGASGPPPLVLG